MKPSNRRKMANYLVMNRLQLKIAAANLCYILLVMGIILLVFMYPFYSDIVEAESPCDQRFFASIFTLLVKRFVPATCLLGTVAFFHQLLLTHKICGPLVNFSRTFKRLAQKDLTREIQLRRNDYLINEARLINQGMDAFNIGISAVKRSNHQILEALERAGDHDMSELETRTALEKAHNSAIQTQSLLDQFRLRQ